MTEAGKQSIHANAVVLAGEDEKFYNEILESQASSTADSLMGFMIRWLRPSQKPESPGW
jgi:hypothetical protein